MLDYFIVTAHSHIKRVLKSADLTQALIRIFLFIPSLSCVHLAPLAFTELHRNCMRVMRETAAH